MPAKKKPAPKKARPSPAKLIFGSSGGVRITLDNARGKQKLILETPGGRTVTLSDSAASIEVTDGVGNAIKLNPAGLSIQAAGRVRINASEITLNAGLVTVEAGTAKFKGLIQCDALVSNSVVSASYSPGVGNIW